MANHVPGPGDHLGTLFFPEGISLLALETEAAQDKVQSLNLAAVCVAQFLWAAA